MRSSGYFNAASHGIPEVAVYEKMAEYLKCEAEIGPENAAPKYAAAIINVRRLAAVLLGGAVSQVGFSSTTTTAWRSMLSRLDLAGKRVLVASHDWGEFHRTIKARGDVIVEVLPPLHGSNPDLAGWAARFDDDVAALFVPMVTAVGGVRYPVEAIGALPKPKAMKYVVDGAQALGQMPVDVGRIGCDVFVSTGRKWLRGPRQASMVWVGNSCDFTAGDLEPADKNNALLLGLGVAIDSFMHTGAAQVQAQIMARSNQIRDWALARAVPVEAGQTGSVSLILTLDGVAKIKGALADGGIIAKPLDTRYFEPNVTDGGTGYALRLSPHVYTSGQDMADLFKALEQGL